MADSKIIHGVRSAAHDDGVRSAPRKPRATVVIADSGTTAEVLVLPTGVNAGHGTQFHYQGSVWVISGTRRDSGIPVAKRATP